MTYTRRAFLALTASGLVAASRRDAAAAEPLWVIRGGIVAWTIFNNEILAVGSRIRAIDIETGQERRGARLSRPSGAEGPSSLAVTPAGIVFGWYVWHEDVRVLCLDQPSFKIRWERRFKVTELERENLPEVFAVARGDGVFVKISEKRSDSLFRLRPETGDVVWARNVPAFATRGPLLWHNNRLLVHSRTHRRGGQAFSDLHAIDPARGSTVWQARLEGASHVAGDTTLIVGDRAYVTSAIFPDGSFSRLHVVDLTAGALLKSLHVPRLGEPFAYDNGILYTGDSSPTAWDTAAQRPLWRTELPQQKGRILYIVAGAFDPRRKRVYLGESTHSFFILSANDGSMVDVVDVRRGYTDKNFMTPYGAYGFELHGDRLIVGAAPESLLAFDARSL